MTDRFRRNVSEENYEAGKKRLITPDRIRPLGYYTLRVLRPMGSEEHAFEELVDIFAVDQVRDALDLYRVRFTEFPDNREPVNQERHFTSNGFLVILNENPRLPGLPELLEIGYILDSDGEIS